MRDATVIAIDPNLPGADIRFRDNSEVQTGVKMTGRAYWNLQIGDYVIVAFLGGSDDPIIIDKVLVHGDPLIEDVEKPGPDDIKVLHTVKDSEGVVTGEVRVHTDNNGELTIEMLGITGSINLKAMGEVGDINLEGAGSINITAPSGVTVSSEDDINVVSGGDTNVTAGGAVKIDGGSSVELGKSLVKKLVNNLPVCLFTGAPHALGNVNVKV